MLYYNHFNSGIKGCLNVFIGNQETKVNPFLPFAFVFFAALWHITAPLVLNKKERPKLPGALFIAGVSIYIRYNHSIRYFARPPSHGNLTQPSLGLRRLSRHIPFHGQSTTPGDH